MWSYGILAVEVFSRGARPYGTWPNLLVLESVQQGYRLPRPTEMPESVYTEVVQPCWVSAAMNSDTVANLTVPANSSPPTKSTTMERNVAAAIHFAPRLSFAELVERLEVVSLEWPTVACDAWVTETRESVAADYPTTDLSGHCGSSDPVYLLHTDDSPASASRIYTSPYSASPVISRTFPYEVMLGAAEDNKDATVVSGSDDSLIIESSTV